jgi:hypothetical protein
MEEIMLTMQVCIMCRKSYGCTNDGKVLTCNDCQDQECMKPDIVWDMQYAFCGNCQNDKLIIVCFSCKKMIGCVENRMNGIRRLCQDCGPKSCWLLNHNGKIIETSTICQPCLERVKNEKEIRAQR